MRSLISSTLSLSLLFSSVAEARLTVQPVKFDVRSAMNSFIKRNSVVALGIDSAAMTDEIDEAYAQAKGEPGKLAKIAGGAGSVALFSLVMLGAGAVAGIAKNGMPKKWPTGEELKKDSLEVADELIKMNTLNALLIGGSKTIEKPMKILLTIAADAKGAVLLREILAHAISNSVAFAAPEALGELYNMAQYVAENDQHATKAEIDRSNEMLRMGYGAIASFLSNDQSYAFDRHVAAMMFNDMYLVALSNPELFEQWMSNVWRKRVLTGPFAVMVTTVTSAAIIGSAVPVAGTIAGIMVGTIAVGVGVVAAYLVPKPWTDKLTAGARHVRLDFINGSLKSNARDLMNSVQTSEYVEPVQLKMPSKFDAPVMKTALPTAQLGSMHAVPADVRLNVFLQRWHARQALRENYATVMYERLFVLNDNLQAEFKEAVTTGQEVDFETPARKIQAYFQALHTLYAADQQLLMDIATKDAGATPGLIEKMQDAIDDLSRLDTYFSSSSAFLLDGSERGILGLTPDGLRAARSIKIFYERGFLEKNVLHPNA